MRRRWDADARYDAQYDASYDPRGGYGPRRRRGGGWTVIGTPFGILGGGRRGFGPGYGGRRRGYGGGGGGCARDACLLESGCCLAESLDGSCLLLTLLALPQLVLALVRPGSPPPRGSQLGGAGRASRVLLALLAVYQRSISGRRNHPVCRYTPSSPPMPPKPSPGTARCGVCGWPSGACFAAGQELLAVPTRFADQQRHVVPL